MRGDKCARHSVVRGDRHALDLDLREPGVGRDDGEGDREVGAGLVHPDPAGHVHEHVGRREVDPGVPGEHRQHQREHERGPYAALDTPQRDERAADARIVEHVAERESRRGESGEGGNGGGKS